MASRSLEDLTQVVRQAAIVHKQLCAVKGVDLLIYATLRSNAEQDEIYKIGRTLPGKIITNARGGFSAHNPNKDGKASAYDAVPLVGGKPQWSGSSPLWAIVGQCGEDAGLVWSGRWTGKLKEQAHWQCPTWRKP